MQDESCGNVQEFPVAFNSENTDLHYWAMIFSEFVHILLRLKKKRGGKKKEYDKK